MRADYLISRLILRTPIFSPVSLNLYTWTMGLELLMNGHHDPGVAQEPLLLRNAPSKNWIVQKFGGTSVGRFAENIAGDIVRLVNDRLAEHRRGTDTMQQAKYQPEPGGRRLFCTQ